jgi:hypothetical protein
MTPRKTLEERDTKIENYEVTPQATWPIAKSLMTRDEPKAPTAIHGPSGLKHHPSEKGSTIDDSLEKIGSHLCDDNHEWRWSLDFKLY